MACVFLSLGSNIDKEKNLSNGLSAIKEVFGSFKASSVYESEAVGFDGDNFYNLVVEVETDKTVGELSRVLREIEKSNGRDRRSPKFSARTLDIDILTYNDLVGVFDSVSLPRREILFNAFVLLPLAEIADDSYHPELKKTYGKLWREFDKDSQKLWPVHFDPFV